MSKEHYWAKFSDWESAEKKWDEGAERAQKEHPLKVLKTLPQMPGIAEDTAKYLKWKSLKWMVKKDENWTIARHVLKHPIMHFFRYIRSLFLKKPYLRDKDFYFYGITGVEDFKYLLKNPDALFIVGFSYCEKPHECPSGRFTPDCIHDPENQVCRQCFVGKSINSLPTTRTIPLLIPTIHYIGQKIFEIKKANPGKEVVFLITACEMTLEMFGDWGNMAGVKGIGVRLDGRICNTMKAFELSEVGIKPGLTVVLEDTQKRILDIFAYWSTTAYTNLEK
jgi:hypothetical protein